MSDEEDDSSKTEDPSQKKLEDARRRGQVPMSREVNNFVMLLAGTIMIMAFAGPLMEKLTINLRSYIEMAGQASTGPGMISSLLGDSFWMVMGAIGIPLVAFMFIAFIGGFIQVGPLLAPEVIKPDISKISIKKGFQRLFSKRSLMEFFKGLLKFGIVGAVGTVLLMPYYGSVEHTVGLEMYDIMHETEDLIIRLMMGVLMALVVLTVIDVVYQRQDHMKKLRMSKQELKDEYRQTEGDPMVKAKLRQLRAEKARQRMMANVPKADVVITNPTHFAVALQYDPEKMEAPLCVAKGMDQVALRIRELAKEHKITIHENPPLARSLYDTVEVDEVIPAEHYKAVAEIISFVFRQKGKLK
ncbi:flagellar biosynthesis protein FlhB [Micavibrio aeruginosavorus]|uniref:Flagellar biosynthetic protein FlhB n=1 Tax=Micavibrio aeruginosavorus (strain ARL-13) TaxID=856793 RepID=G2KRQ1_MICAA|nr:flagellar biosynthesis protein FlhB [Micavibrio aeruginosavorus]AEP10009.1 flagellar biosynthetic protein FlhB [Micavibrio aeruginosavorus ARL-13]